MNVHTLDAKTIKVLKYAFNVFIRELVPKKRVSPNNPGRYGGFLALFSKSISFSERFLPRSPIMSNDVYIRLW